MKTPLYDTGWPDAPVASQPGPLAEIVIYKSAECPRCGGTGKVDEAASRPSPACGEGMRARCWRCTMTFRVGAYPGQNANAGEFMRCAEPECLLAFRAVKRCLKRRVGITAVDPIIVSVTPEEAERMRLVMDDTEAPTPSAAGEV